jgi:hypothetical protein
MRNTGDRLTDGDQAFGLEVGIVQTGVFDSDGRLSSQDNHGVEIRIEKGPQFLLSRALN